MNNVPETSKQRDFISAIATELNLKEPNPLTKEQASMWISNHVDEFNQRKEQRRENAMFRELEKQQRYGYL